MGQERAVYWGKRRFEWRRTDMRRERRRQVGEGGGTGGSECFRCKILVSIMA